MEMTAKQDKRCCEANKNWCRKNCST